MPNAAPPPSAESRDANAAYAEGTIGRLMEPAYGIFDPGMTVGEAIESLRGVVRTAFVTYGYVLEADGRLAGLVTMRDLLFSEKSERLESVMLRDVFTLGPDRAVSDAMRLTPPKSPAARPRFPGDPASRPA